MAASLIRFESSAPLNPGVSLASESKVTSGARGLPAAWTFKMALRPSISGRSMVTRRSKRPGLSKAGSRMSGRLVAAITMILVLVSKPSISTRIWFRVCSRSSCPPPRPAPRWRPTASISSTNTIHGALRLACSKRSLTLAAPTPTNISTNSEPLMWKNGTPASPATARAIRVLPVPGDPTSSTPLGMRAPRARNRSGNLRNSTTSWSSSLDSSTPATSAKDTVGLFKVIILARLRPKLMVWLLLPCAWRIMNNMRPPKKIKGRKFSINPRKLLRPLEPLKTTSTPEGGPTSTPLSTNRLSTSVSRPILLVNRSVPAVLVTLGNTVIFRPSMIISRMSLFLAMATTVVNGSSARAPKLGNIV